MMTRTLTRAAAGIASVLLALFTLGACGDDDDATVEQTDGEPAPAEPQDEPQDEPGDDPAGPDGAAGAGTVEVDGATYAVEQVHRCEPYDDGTIDRDLELQGRGSVDGERFQIDVYVQSIGEMPFPDVSWAGPEGVFGGGEEVQIDWDGGDQVTGSAVLMDSLEGTDTIELTFDLPVPSDLMACR